MMPQVLFTARLGHTGDFLCALPTQCCIWKRFFGAAQQSNPMAVHITNLPSITFFFKSVTYLG